MRILPFWSPDSRFIGFFAQGKLKKIDASGGSPQTLCDAPAGNGGTWNREGVIVFAPNREGVLARVSAAGGIPAAVTALDRRRQETAHLWPQFLPDGRHFLYLALSGQRENRGLYVGSLGSDRAATRAEDRSQGGFRAAGPSALRAVGDADGPAVQSESHAAHRRTGRRRRRGGLQPVQWPGHLHASRRTACSSIGRAASGACRRASSSGSIARGSGSDRLTAPACT